MCNLCLRRWVISLDIFMHIICTSVWAEWERPDMLIKAPKATIHTYRSAAKVAAPSNSILVTRQRRWILILEHGEENVLMSSVDALSSTHSCQPTTMAVAYRRPE